MLKYVQNGEKLRDKIKNF